MNTTTYKNLKLRHLDSEENKKRAKDLFGDMQPSIFWTGQYSAPSWNWAYLIGIVGVSRENGPTTYYEVVTQFGTVISAIELYLPEVRAN